jgi:hypothetical protein
MQVDKAAFFLALTTLAAGGAGGYLAAKNGVFDRLSSPGVAERQPASFTTPQGSAASEAPADHGAPVCDDMVGIPAACPPPGYSADEGGCDALPTRRCEDFKRTMKPRVAEHAVACLNALTPAQRCDANRLNACGHVALMSACSADDVASTGPTASDALVSRCEAIVQASAGTPLSPTMRDCQATLAGMTAAGRDRMASCMATHGADRGLVGCESAQDVR